MIGVGQIVYLSIKRVQTDYGKLYGDGCNKKMNTQRINMFNYAIDMLNDLHKINKSFSRYEIENIDDKNNGTAFLELSSYKKNGYECISLFIDLDDPCGFNFSIYNKSNDSIDYFKSILMKIIPDLNEKYSLTNEKGVQSLNGKYDFISYDYNIKYDLNQYNDFIAVLHDVILLFNKYSENNGNSPNVV